MTTLKNYKFRPKSKIRRFGQSTYHFQERHTIVRDEPINEATLGRIFGRLHYLVMHAPDAVSRKHYSAIHRFEKRFPTNKTSIKYSNTYSIHRFI